MSGKENWYGQQGILPYSHHQRVATATRAGPSCGPDESVETTQIQPSPITRYASSPLMVDVKGFRSPELGKYLDQEGSCGPQQSSWVREQAPSTAASNAPKETRIPPDTVTNERHGPQGNSKMLALTIDLGGGRSDTIHILSKRSIGNDVEAFVRRNQLDSSLTPIIQKYVMTQYEATIPDAKGCRETESSLTAPVHSQKLKGLDTDSQESSLPPKQHSCGLSKHSDTDKSWHQGTQKTPSRTNVAIDTDPSEAEAVRFEQEAHSPTENMSSCSSGAQPTQLERPENDIHEPHAAVSVQRAHTGKGSSIDKQPLTAKARFKNTGSSYYKKHYQKRKQFLKAASGRQKQLQKPKQAPSAVPVVNCRNMQKACKDADSLHVARIKSQAQATKISVRSSCDEVLRCSSTQNKAAPDNSQHFQPKPSVARQKNRKGNVFDRLYSNGTFTCSGGGAISAEKIILLEDSDGGRSDSNDEKPTTGHNDHLVQKAGDESPSNEGALVDTPNDHVGFSLSSAPSRRLQPPQFDLSHSSDEEHSSSPLKQPPSHTDSHDLELEQALAAVPPHQKKDSENVINLQSSTAVGANSQPNRPLSTTEVSVGSNRLDSITERLYTAAVQHQRESLAARQSERERLQEERSRVWTCPCCGAENSSTRDNCTNLVKGRACAESRPTRPFEPKTNCHSHQMLREKYLKPTLSGSVQNQQCELPSNQCELHAVEKLPGHDSLEADSTAHVNKTHQESSVQHLSLRERPKKPKASKLPRVAQLAMKNEKKYGLENRTACVKSSEERALEQCIFKPTLCAKSARLAAAARRKAAAGANALDDFSNADTKLVLADQAHDRLYRLAKRKQQENAAREEAIASAKLHAAQRQERAARCEAGSPAPVFERLYSARTEIERRHKEMAHQMSTIDPTTGQPLFYPVVGRGPRGRHGTVATDVRLATALDEQDENSDTARSVEHRSKSTVHDFLYAARHEYDDLHRALRIAEEGDLEQMRDPSWHVNTKSRSMLQKVERQMLNDAFCALTKDAHGCQQRNVPNPAVARLADIGPCLDERCDALQPEELRRIVKTTMRSICGDYHKVVLQGCSTISFADFCNEVRQNFPASEIHVAVRAFIRYTRETARNERRTVSPQPNLLCPKSRELAVGRRGRGVKPVHQVLLEEGRAYEVKRLEREQTQRDKETEGCTFKPELCPFPNEIFNQKGKEKAIAPQLLDATEPSMSNSTHSTGFMTARSAVAHCDSQAAQQKPTSFYHMFKRKDDGSTLTTSNVTNDDNEIIASTVMQTTVHSTSAPSNSARPQTSVFRTGSSKLSASAQEVSGPNVTFEQSRQQDAGENADENDGKATTSQSLSDAVKNTSVVESEVEVEVSNIAVPGLWLEDDTEDDVLRGSWSLVPPGRAHVVEDIPVAVIDRGGTSYLHADTSILSVGAEVDSPNTARGVQGRSSPSNMNCSGTLPTEAGHKAHGALDKFLISCSTEGAEASSDSAHAKPIQIPVCTLTDCASNQESATPRGSTKDPFSLSTAASAPVANSVVKRPLSTHVLSTVRQQLKHLKKKPRDRRKHVKRT